VEHLGRTGANTVERDEHVHNVLRLRRGAIVGLIAWPLFGLVDWYVVEFVEPGRLWFYLGLRLVGLLLMLGAVLTVYARRMPSPGLLRVVDCVTCAGLAIIVSITCHEFGGIASPLALGIVTILVARSAILSDHWRRGILPIGLTAAAHPVTLIAMGAALPSMATQFADSALLAQFVLNQMFIMGAAILILIGGHIMWAMKRQVFEARSLGRYRLKQRIGVGGMGEVWAAHHHALKRDVAVKILRPENSSDDTAVARFEREVRATSELNHPHTVRVFDYGVTDDGLWYYAMELLEGRDLLRVVQEDGPLDPSRATRLMLQAARALAEAHGRGITHRDLKPENLFLTAIGGEGDFIKVLDFGLAKVAGGEGNPNLTNAGWAVGTPRYVSPEVVFGHPADARSDVYALGAVLYFLLSGQTPFDYEEMRQTLMAHLREAPVPPSSKLGRPLPRAVEEVVMRCLEKDPARRYVDASELARALDAALLAVAEEDETRVHVPRAPEVGQESPALAVVPGQRRDGAVEPRALRPGSGGWSDDDSLDRPDGLDTLDDHDTFSAGAWR
jgi:eukaryotic-like serine/threonine-protein kinase